MRLKCRKDIQSVKSGWSIFKSVSYLILDGVIKDVKWTQTHAHTHTHTCAHAYIYTNKHTLFLSVITVSLGMGQFRFSSVKQFFDNV